MGKTTKIEWCDSSVNGQMGCDGCEIFDVRTNSGSCYAGVDITKKKGSNSGMPAEFGNPELYPYRIIDACKWPDLTGTKRPGKPWLDGKPRMIFLDDYGDTFTRSLGDTSYVRALWEAVRSGAGSRAQQSSTSRSMFLASLHAVELGGHWLDPFVPMMEASPHIWLILTKRAQRMRRFFEDLGRVPSNFWPMVSITQPRQVERLRHLRAIGDVSTIRGVSYEPILEPVDFGDYLDDISWLIPGGESGRDARPCRLEWLDDIVSQCWDAGTSVLVKQLGAHVLTSNGGQGSLYCDAEVSRLYLREKKGGDPSEWPGGLKRFPREMPEVSS